MRADLENINIFQSDSSDPVLHIEFRCKYNNNDVTKDVFERLQQFSLGSKEKKTWHKIYTNLLIKYNVTQNKIAFKEEIKSQPSSLSLLPSLLLRDWCVINKQQKELLETRIENSPLLNAATKNQPHM